MTSEFEEIYKLADTTRIFTNLNTLKFLDENGNKYLLKEAFANKLITVDYLKEKATDNTIANDGGSKIYFFKKENLPFINEDFEMHVCNAIEGRKDIYIIKGNRNICTE
ncbi:MAG TPA: hypothetical protein DCY94_03850 [Firmicutes bacterium]|nr:hypothetical protein [Bacillota bacterium]